MDDNREDGATTDLFPAVTDDADVAQTKALKPPTDDIPTDPVRVAYDEDETEHLAASAFDAPTSERTAAAIVVPVALASEDDDTLKVGEEQVLHRSPGRKPPADPTRPAQLFERPPERLPPVHQPPEQPRPPGASRPFWRKDSFWSNRPPTQPAELQPTPQHLEARAKRTRVVALIAVAVASMFLVTVTISTWMSPGDVLLLSLALGLLVAAATGWIMRPDDLRKFRTADLRLLAKPVALAALMLFAFSLPWQLGPVRKLLRGLAAESPEIVREVLRDRADSVVLAECLRIAPRYLNSEVATALASGLPGRPDAARSCLNTAAHGPVLARAIMQRWHPALVTQGEDVACPVAQTIGVLPLPAWELQAPLADCVVASPNEAARACCATALAAARAGADDWMAGQPPDWTPNERTAAALLRLALDAEATSEERRASAKFNEPAAARMAILVGCDATDRDANLGEEFAAALADCEVDRAKLPRDRKTWSTICATARPQITPPNSNATAELCRATVRVIDE